MCEYWYFISSIIVKYEPAEPYTYLLHNLTNFGWSILKEREICIYIYILCVLPEENVHNNPVNKAF